MVENSLLEVIQKIQLLQPFSSNEVDKIIALGSTLHYEENTNVIIEGELSWGLYLILNGSVGIYKTNKLTGNAYDIAELHNGNFFGEMSLIDESPRFATVRTLKKCDFFYLSRYSFNQYIDSSTSVKLKFYENCVKNLVNRLRELDDHYVISQYQLWETVLNKKGDSV